MNFLNYVEKAKEKNNYKYLSQVSEGLSMTKGAFSFLYNGKGLPTEETVVKLADLAGIDAEEALLDLSIWRAKKIKDKRILEAYKKIKKYYEKIAG